MGLEHRIENRVETLALDAAARDLFALMAKGTGLLAEGHPFRNTDTPWRCEGGVSLAFRQLLAYGLAEIRHLSPPHEGDDGVWRYEIIPTKRGTEWAASGFPQIAPPTSGMRARRAGR